MSKAIALFAGLLVVTALLVGCGSEVAAPTEGTILHGNVTHNDDGHYYVYTPPGYDAAGSYPALYLLNGFGFDENYFKSMFSATDASDLLLGEGSIDPMIIVLPSGASDLGGTFYTNSLHPTVGNAEDGIVAVIHEVEANYAIDTTRRAIGGHSMGGYGALSIALNHPGMFAAVSVMSAPISFWGTMTSPPHDDSTYKGIWEVLPAALQETGYDTVLAATLGAGDTTAYKQMMYPSPDRRVTSMMFAMAAAFSPTEFDPNTGFPIYVPTTIDSIIVGVDGDGVPIKSPMWVDLPLGIDASVETAVWNRWMAKDCLARFAGGQAASLAGVKLYLDAGLQDDLGLYGAHQTFSGAYQLAFSGAVPDNESYFDKLEDVFGDIPAGHVEQTWERVLKLLVWHSGQF